MKRKILYTLGLFVLMFMTSIYSYSQQVNTLYFMENVPVRNSLNPAFQPLNDFYLGLPVLGSTQFSLSNNSFVLNDYIYKDTNGNPITAFHPNGDKTQFFNAIKNSITTNVDLNVSLLDFGFRVGQSYWNMSVNQRAISKATIPSDFIKLLLYGTPDLQQNFYDLNSVSLNTIAFTEVGLGYANKLNDKLQIGGKLKFLLGNANVSTTNESLKLSANIEEWTLIGNGSVNYSSPVDLNGNSIKTFNPTFSNSIADYIKPSGYGVGLDLGITFKPIDNLNLSFAVLDLGMIKWTKNVKSVGYNVDFKYTGVDTLGLDFSLNLEDYGTEILDDLENSFTDTVKSTVTSYSTALSPKFNIGAEYGFLQNKLSVGLLSRTLLESNKLYEELTASINGRPVNWFNMSASYSVVNGRMNTVGAGLGLRTGFLNWFFTADYISFNYIPFSLNRLSSSLPTMAALIPSNTKGVNFALGLNLVLGNKKDADKDGVADKNDLCPGTPKNVKVNKDGCPKDSDGDGVPDDLDKCPNTIEVAIANVDSVGCEKDSDQDGKPDWLDKCPDTPLGIEVDSVGCPIDSDQDGVFDSVDKCPNTPLRAKEMVDENGCPKDSDGDGVPDYMDLDNADEKPDADNVSADVNPIDVPIDNNNTEDVKNAKTKKTLESLFQKALQGISFGSGNDVIAYDSNIILNQIASVLIANPTYIIEIRGYTDNIGNDDTNLLLSKKRAQSVMKYFQSKGIDSSRMTANGFGETFPVADNKTASGRAKNRRVEFIVSYEEITFE